MISGYRSSEFENMRANTMRWTAKARSQHINTAPPHLPARNPGMYGTTDSQQWQILKAGMKVVVSKSLLYVTFRHKRYFK